MARPWNGTIYRAVIERYSGVAHLISGEGAKRVGGRWNPPGEFTVAYGSLELETAMKEVLEHARYYGIEPKRILPRIFFAIDVELARVVDLTEGTARRKLGVSLQRMGSTDWRQEMEHGREALTQAIGRAAHGLEIEGLLVPSKPARNGKNLLVFPQNMESASRIQVYRQE